MALQTKRERVLFGLVLGSAFVAVVTLATTQVMGYLASMDEEIAAGMAELEKKREIYANLEGIEDMFTKVWEDLSIPGEIDQQKAVVVQALIDLIGAAGIEYGSVKLDDNVEQKEEDFYLVRLTIEDIRTERTKLAEFLYLVNDVATMEVEQLNVRASNRPNDPILRATVKVTRLIPTKEYMRGLEEL